MSSSIFGSSASSSSSSPSSSNPSSAEIKAAVLQRLQQETAISNVRQLMQKINENCFEKCISSPGSSLSSKDQACLSACTEKYVSLWNAISRAYISRIGKEQAQGGFGNQPASSF
ncbi:protein translocase subunit [Myotisia sp. PD_48]|nr:protein translocase subunit [Myotisia sp. PD_48]